MKGKALTPPWDLKIGETRGPQPGHVCAHVAQDFCRGLRSPGRLAAASAAMEAARAELSSLPQEPVSDQGGQAEHVWSMLCLG